MKFGVCFDDGMNRIWGKELQWKMMKREIVEEFVDL